MQKNFLNGNNYKVICDGLSVQQQDVSSESHQLRRTSETKPCLSLMHTLTPIDTFT